MKNFRNTAYVIIAAIAGYMLAIKNTNEQRSEIFANILTNATYIDLTQILDTNIPNGPGPEAAKIETLLSHTPGEGVMNGTGSIHRYSFPGQWGTHVDPPIHFIKDLRTLEEIELNEMILPLVVLDIHEKVEANPDYQVSMEDVRVWEKVYGSIPEKTFVALRTDWSKRWPNTDLIRNWDETGVSHSPGWSMEVLKYLAEQRNVTAIGHETMDTDIGKLAAVGNYPLETYFLSQNKYQIENMKALDKVPQWGAFIITAWPLPKAGDGFPARVFALIPKQLTDNK
ncbi:MAG: cyclase family protein [Kordiimonadaceae bacterium]|nr:cyclase family protein [Kordiimonadaceae bacterium]